MHDFFSLRLYCAIVKDDPIYCSNSQTVLLAVLWMQSLTGATKPGEGTTYLGNDTPNLMGSLSQDCTRAGAPAYCYGVTRATMVKEGWGTSNAAASTKRIFG